MHDPRLWWGAVAGDWEELLRRAAERLEEVPPVIRLEARRLLLVGDTHGFPEVSRWALGLAREEGVDYTVFLGDYVDRGPMGVENLELLLEALLGGGVLLLRGNHESLEMNYYYGFMEEAESKRGEEYLRLVEEVYRRLPYIVLAGGVFMVHGGVPCRVCRSGPEDPVPLAEIEERLQRIKGREEASEPSDPVAMQLLWNDPRGTIEWFMPSPRGPGIYLYGRRAWQSFLEENKLSLIIRAHEVVDGVHVWTRDGGQLRGIEEGDELSLEELRGCVVTVFSSLYHGGRAAALLLDLERGVVSPRFYPGGSGGGGV